MGLLLEPKPDSGGLVAVIRPFLVATQEHTCRGSPFGGRLLLSHSRTGEILSAIKCEDELDNTNGTRLQVVV